MNIPRIVIAGTQSGVGKTTVTIGLMAALREAGFIVQGFKVGPDYIDSSYHYAVTNRPSENLDVWLTPKDQIIEMFAKASEGANFAIIEGVMGLFDSVSGLDETGSTSQIAKILGCPIILIIDVHQTVRSSAAIALGFKNFDRNADVRGIILNNVAGKVHANWCTDAINAATGLPVVGCLPVNDKVKLPERHLGLIPTAEKKTLKSFIPEIKNHIQKNVDIKQVINIASNVKNFPKPKKTIYPNNPLPKSVRIGVALDEAFNFYYPANLRLLEEYGAELSYFSPIHDKILPKDITGLYVGGGFPEYFLNELEANNRIKETILSCVDNNMPVYGECAGLMYLSRSITDFDGKTYQMVGAFEGNTVMTKRTLVTYSEAHAISNNCLCLRSSTIKGHEFHNSVVTDIPQDAKFAFKMIMGEGITGKKEGWIKNQTLGSYMHIHFAQDIKIVESFIKHCKLFSQHMCN